ncbi:MULTISPECIES: hypothetical protein [unclassified Streptomyces]|uniref:hypothetical protein n=1 Tax=unclassified Streptomyces TaxID=2593676 RepID=UPI000DBAC159|nr:MULTISPECIES: hypothetical protein [unclassified Streptomyces]MYT69031.1 hypothetical protein [Streptomyces sp. SID8367]RAJ82538.1 hypothetical protein K377_04258 [Streptomyces sp. PsTaAH-137]
MPQPAAFHDLGALRFDGGAALEPGSVDRVRAAVRDSGVRELYVVVHGAHNDEAVGAAVDGAYRHLLAEAWHDAPGRAGMLAVRWPSLCFRDEDLPGVGHRADGTEVDQETFRDLVRHLPGHDDELAEIVALLRDRPDHETAFDDFGSQLRRLAEVPLQDPVAPFGGDTEGEILPQSDPLMLFEDTRTMCAEFAGALQDLRRAGDTGSARHEDDRRGIAAGEDPLAALRPAQPLSERVGRVGTVTSGGPLGERAAADRAELWEGARELFRQVVRHMLRRRAGYIGELGLGPVLPALAEDSGIRLHLVGHGLGARLAGFALRGLERGGAEPVLLSSLTLLQGEMSHFAFADSLPQQFSGHGALWSLQRLVQGPLFCTFSHLDFHLGVLYPLSAQMIGDSVDTVSIARKWGALGFDGIQGVEGPAPARLGETGKEDLRRLPYLNVDVSEVIRSADRPLSGHHEVMGPEIGQLLRQAADVPGGAR